MKKRFIAPVAKKSLASNPKFQRGDQKGILGKCSFRRFSLKMNMAWSSEKMSLPSELSKKLQMQSRGARIAQRGQAKFALYLISAQAKSVPHRTSPLMLGPCSKLYGLVHQSEKSQISNPIEKISNEPQFQRPLRKNEIKMRRNAGIIRTLPAGMSSRWYSSQRRKVLPARDIKTSRRPKDRKQALAVNGRESNSVGLSDTALNY